MYDMDVPAINGKLNDCRAYKLLSNPAIELWFLLHGKDKKTKLSTEDAFNELLKMDDCWAGYEKAALTDTQKAFLWEHRLEATERARKLNVVVARFNASEIMHAVLLALIFQIF